MKSTGDGLLVLFSTSVGDAIGCAIAMQRGIGRLDRENPLLGLGLRVGIAVGEASSEEDDWHGTPVVEAARLCAAARSGQILVADLARQLVVAEAGIGSPQWDRWNSRASSPCWCQKPSGRPSRAIPCSLCLRRWKPAISGRSSDDAASASGSRTPGAGSAMAGRAWCSSRAKRESVGRALPPRWRAPCTAAVRPCSTAAVGSTSPSPTNRSPRRSRGTSRPRPR